MYIINYGWHIAFFTMEITSNHNFIIIKFFSPNSKALDVYTELSKKPNYDINIHTNKACCLYALARYKEAFEEAKKGSNTELNVYIFI